MIPLHTLAERDLVAVYVLVWVLQFGYAIRLGVEWWRGRR